MGEFRESIKQLHHKLMHDFSKRQKRVGGVNDSVDDLTDLEDEGILTTSKLLLSE